MTVRMRSKNLHVCFPSKKSAQDSVLLAFKMVTCTVQVTNVSPLASERQMKELFSYFGGIDEIRVYPEELSLINVFQW